MNWHDLALLGIGAGAACIGITAAALVWEYGSTALGAGKSLGSTIVADAQAVEEKVAGVAKLASSAVTNLRNEVVGAFDNLHRDWSTELNLIRSESAAAVARFEALEKAVFGKVMTPAPAGTTPVAPAPATPAVV